MRLASVRARSPRRQPVTNATARATAHGARPDVNLRPYQCTHRPLMRGSSREQHTQPGTVWRRGSCMWRLSRMESVEKSHARGPWITRPLRRTRGEIPRNTALPVSTGAVPLPGRRRDAEITYICTHDTGPPQTGKRTSAPDARSRGTSPQQGRDGPIVRTQTTPKAKRTAHDMK